MPARKLVALFSIALVLTLGSPPALSASGGQVSILKVHKNLPVDPLLVMAFSMEDPAAALDEFVKMVEQFGGEESAVAVARILEDLDDKLDISFRDDLLERLGPDTAIVIDLPPLDSLAALMGPGGAATIKKFLGGIGFTGNTDNGKKLGVALEKMMVDAGAEVSEKDGLTRFAFKLPVVGGGKSEGGGTTLDLIYGKKKKSYALGFSEDWVRNALSGWPAGMRLEDGADYAKVASHLDAEFSSLIYLNLPKARQLVANSALLKGFISSNPEAMRFYSWFTTSDFMTIGLGSTSISVDCGARTSIFGPDWIDNGTALMGMMAAFAIPRYKEGSDQERRKRTLADMRSLGTSIEAFAVDKDQYPGPTDGLLPVGILAGQLEPGYINALPRTDGWGGEFLYWSDTSRYRIVSKGADGKLDQDWSLATEVSGGTDPGRDIVLADGVFLVTAEEFPGSSER